MTGLPVRSAIDAGLALLATGSSGEHSPIRVDRPSSALLEGTFEIDATDGFPLLRGETENLTANRKLLGKATPFVGRDAELVTLSALLEQCAAEPQARAVLVTGPAGVGKSRLCKEFILGVHDREETTVLLARGDPTRTGLPFGLVAQMLRRAAGLREDEPATMREETLRAYLAARIAEEDLTHANEFLGTFLALRSADPPSAAMIAAQHDPTLMDEKLRSLWTAWLAAECRTRPVLMVLEDLHWGDLPSLRFVDTVLRRLADQPILVLGVGRPEIHDTFPLLWAERSVQELCIGDLPRKASGRLVAQTLGLDANNPVVERIVTMAAGNVAYLEELIRATASGHADGLSETLLGMIEASIDHVPPMGKLVLRAASLFGDVFWRGGVMAILEAVTHTDDVRKWLALLAQQEWIKHCSEARFAGEDEYVFRHGLLREALYATLTDSDREVGHRMAAAWLEQARERTQRVLDKE